jgi:ABC-type multidrug transport system ATPase subunit
MRKAPTGLDALRFNGVSAGYVEGADVLDDVSLSLSVPGVVHVLGENGCGKSTLVELASGYLAPRVGQVRVFGEPAHSAGARRRRRVCRSRPALFPAMTVRDHLAFSAMCVGGSRQGELERADRLGLTPWFDSDSATLSTGSVRKLWFLMTTAGSFDMVLLDEPLNGLDADAQGLVVEDIARWSRSVLVVLSSHFLPRSLAIDQELVLGRGTADLRAVCTRGALL